MAKPPLTFLERKWAHGGSNQLVKASTQNDQRYQVPDLGQDTHRNISRLGRETLMWIGRYLYWNCDVLRGAIDEIARLAVGSYIPQYYGRNRAWGDQAEGWLYENDKFCDLRGWPYTMDHLDHNLVVQCIVDGDMGIGLTEHNGMPKLQTWGSHRIGSREWQYTLNGGQYDGATVRDGVILDEFGGATGYVLRGEDRWTDEIAQVSANDFLLCYLPTVNDQYRGISLLGVSAFTWQDWSEAKAFELIAQKIGATLSKQVYNETGTVDKTKSLLELPVNGTDTTGSSLPKEIFQPGKVLYFRAGKGERVEDVTTDRPSGNTMAFMDESIRGGLESIGWSFDFAHNSTRIGGAPMRVVVDRLQRRLEQIRCLLVKPVRRRIDGWRVSKAIKMGALPDDVDWYKFDYQGPANITADKRYDSDVDLQETARGIQTEQNAIAKRGGYLEDVYADKVAAADMRSQMALEHSQKYGTTFMESYSILWNPPTGGLMVVAQPAQPAQGKNEPEEDTEKGPEE